MSYNKNLKLVGHVGEKSHLTSSLDCYGKLSLVKSAGSGYASGEDLSSLRDELSELCYVLVVDSVYFILAEDANLLSSGADGGSAIYVVLAKSEKELYIVA